MTTIVSYNILAGGYNINNNGAKRTRELVSIIRSVQPDIVGVAEATNARIMDKPLVIEEVAKQLGMQLILGGDPHDYEYQVACMTRLPVVSTRLHRIANASHFTRPVLEVCVEEANGEQLTMFVTHLSAAFSHGWAGTHIREREVRELLRITRPHREQGLPHVIVGDFNTLAPGDPFKASFLLRYVVHMDQRDKNKQHIPDGNPYLNFVVPPRLRFLNPLLRIIPRHRLLAALFDMAASFYAPRGPIALLQHAGYNDCYRQHNPHNWGFTCPAAAPAGRIDFIFANAPLAQRLENCHEILLGDNGVTGEQASDHLALAATFGLPVQTSPKEQTPYEVATVK